MDTQPHHPPYPALSIDDLVAGLAPGSNCVLVDVQAALILHGTAATDALIAALQNEDVHLAANAAAVLGRIGDDRAVPYLLDLLQAFDWTLREQAAIALGRLADQRTQPMLKQVAAEDDTPSVRRAAAQALRQLAAKAHAAPPD